MKISTYVLLLVCVGAVLFVYASMMSESAQRYPEANINSSEWAGKYDYALEVNKSISPLQNAFAKIQDENTGWFTKLTAGITAIPLAIIELPTLLFKSFSLGGSLITGIFTSFGLPAYFIIVAIILIIVWGIFKLAEVYQRWPL